MVRINWTIQAKNDLQDIAEVSTSANLNSRHR